MSPRSKRILTRSKSLHRALQSNRRFALSRKAVVVARIARKSLPACVQIQPSPERERPSDFAEKTDPID